MAEFNTPVGVHFWRQVTEGVSRFVSFVDNTWALDTSKVKWATTLNTLNVKLPATPSKTTSATAETIWTTLTQVESELDDWTVTDVQDNIIWLKHVTTAKIWIKACKSRTRAFRFYRIAFNAFHLGGPCNLCKYLETFFPSWAHNICMSLGALEKEHLTLIDVGQDYEKELRFLSHLERCNLADIVRAIKLEIEQTKQELARRVPPRQPLVVVLSDSKAQLEYMRACLLGV